MTDKRFCQTRRFFYQKQPKKSSREKYSRGGGKTRVENRGKHPKTSCFFLLGKTTHVVDMRFMEGLKTFKEVGNQILTKSHQKSHFGVSDILH